MTPSLLTGPDFRRMIQGAASRVEVEKETINALNVFPVPDGDTGTNMSLTLSAAVAGLSQQETHSLGHLASSVALGSLMGARGNSGVILAQVLRGFAQGLTGKESATHDEVAKAFQYGILFAYSAVSAPVEGTILSVLRGIAKGARDAVRTRADMRGVLEVGIQAGERALAKTPDQLPILKECGVVDAGGYGLLVFLKGCLRGLVTEQPESLDEVPVAPPPPPPLLQVEPKLAGPRQPEVQQLRFHYCTELIIKGDHLPDRSLEGALNLLGDSLVLVQDKGLAKVHVHTNHPGRVLEHCLQLGSLHMIKIDNMMDQHSEKVLGETQKGTPDLSEVQHLEAAERGLALVSVAAGEGISRLFRSLGVAEVVTGGQTMNPSVYDLLQAVNRVPARRVMVLPNNGNIIPAAAQLPELTDKEVTIVPTRTIQEGLAAALAFNPALPPEENSLEMKVRAQKVKSGEVTFAVRSATYKGEHLAEGALLGISGKEILTSGEDLDNVVVNLIKAMLEEGDEILSLFYGKDVSAEEAETLARRLENEFPELEVELQEGGQPLHYYLIAIE